MIENLFRVANSINVRFTAHRAARDTVKELSKLSNRELNDIGLNRCDINYIATKQYDELVEASSKKVPLYRRMPEGILDI